MDNKIELKPIKDLLGLNFYIPAYQRGYRWTRQQVKDLLNDIQEFKDKKKKGFYCIQPLVVKRSIPSEKLQAFKSELDAVIKTTDNQTIVDTTEKAIADNTLWEVIDGQQRLTTIFILLQQLNQCKPYSLEYQTREKSKVFLASINEQEKDNNIDFYHIFEANKEIQSWFNDKNELKKSYLETLLDDVQFIWYESVDENPITVFTRLNIGKIGLTNAELIKALFLNKSNFDGSNQRIRLQQNEIAMEWDRIEYTLQNDEFWLFLHDKDYGKPTRIDFILDLIVEKNLLSLPEKEYSAIGSDEHQTFRYFYEWVNQKDKAQNIIEGWSVVKVMSQTFQEWFNDLELYHLIGFLLEKKKTKNGVEISEILENWKKTKNDFKSDYLYRKIKEKIKNKKEFDLEKIVSKDDDCVRPILLLHNIQTIIKQNKALIKNDKYKLSVFYKFPFHLFKKESWDVEHIDSNIENELGNVKDQKEWLKYSYEFVPEEAKISNNTISDNSIKDLNIREEIRKFISNTDKKNNEIVSFEELYYNVILNTSTHENKLNDDEKNHLWNFALLDSSSNRGYGNAIFPAKRRILLGKDKGRKITVDDNFVIEEKKGAVAFIPPCTKYVFLKYYNPMSNNLREWDRTDAKAYLDNIKDALKTFLQ